jgi:HPt (histidine-containing phosphotransfer) domain-containing protein
MVLLEHLRHHRGVFKASVAEDPCPVASYAWLVPGIRLSPLPPSPANGASNGASGRTKPKKNSPPFTFCLRSPAKDQFPPEHWASKGAAVDDLLSDFLTETNESLAELDVALVTLERTPDDAETLGFIFRLVHTIKGTCGFLGLPRLERVAHAGENVLGKLRDRSLAVTPILSVRFWPRSIGSRRS